MKYIDMHCDTIMHLWHRKLQGKTYSINKNELMVDIEKLERGECLCQNFALFVFLKLPTNFNGTWEYNENITEYRDPWETFQDMLAVYQEVINHSPLLEKALNAADIVENEKRNRISSLLTIEEGGCCKGDIRKLKEAYDDGVRMMTLTWNFDNELGHANHPGKDHYDYYNFSGEASKGLSDKGKEFVYEMEKLHMIVDVSHLSDRGFYDVAALMDHPFVASHSNARAVTGCSRNLSDDMIRTLAEHGGVMGLNFTPEFLDLSDTPQEKVDYIVRHARHIINVGGKECLGIGSDFDGIKGVMDLHDASYLQLLYNKLKKNSFSESEIEGIFYKNVLRVYQEIL